MSDENRPTFRSPDEAEQKKNADPNADMAAYFAHYEAKRITDEMKRRRDWDSLSIYERARIKNRQE
jgi:hypothetical protein